MIEFPLGLRTAIESGNCVLFLGAGLGDHVRDSNGEPAPDGATLAQELASEFSIDVPPEPDLAQVASVVELRRGRADLKAFLQKRLAGLEADESFRWLFTIRWAAVFTTNYDNVIERAYELIPDPPQKPIPITLASEFVHHDPRFEIPIYHLHGSLFGAGNPHILITEDDYSRFREPRRMIFEVLKSEFAKAPALFIGYSNRDPNWKILMTELTAEFFPAEIPQSFRLSPHVDALQDELLQSKNIVTIKATYQEFFEVASTTISGAAQDSDRYLEIKKTIPTDLVPHFEKNPAPVARLLSSWDYVNQVNFHEKPNTHSFLRGDRANWSLVGISQIFERDLEEEIYDALLDYATISSKKPKTAIILGSAGYGTTTLLMALAAKLVTDKAGPVFMLRPQNPLLEGDIEFAVTAFESRPFFIIDNAADYSGTIDTILGRLRDQGKPAFLLLGERLNEWRQGHGKLNANEYLIEPMSDLEIHRLIDLLAETSELGDLSKLNRNMQIAAIKKKHGKELLVTLREVTEGKSFDAILEDEYRGIRPAIARDLYMTVACFHQHGAYVRDKLLSKILDISLTDLFERTSDSTEGVIMYEDVDKSRGTYAARTRHRTIAKVVWERCGLPEEWDSLLTRSLSAINLNYGLDKRAFEDFVRSDYSIDQIRTLEGKIKFFETAAKKDPGSPYVKQHYARMLLREDKPDLALGQIDQAIELSPRTRVLHHTRGTILMSLAFSAGSPEIARRRLIQSEASFRISLSLYKRDEYSYQGLVQLYRGWAELAPTPEESTNYIAKAEETVTEGLKQVRVRSSLWIESSKIQAYLGNQPSRLEALEKAVHDTPGSIIARYLLGRAYRFDGRFDDALAILKPVIESHHEEFRAFVEYSIALAIVQQSYEEAIPTLQLSTLYGLSDPRFIATLGGMQIMTGQISDGKNTFDESIRRNFRSEEMNKIQFRPRDLSNYPAPLMLDGVVIVRKASYALIESEGFSLFLIPGSRIGSQTFEKGLRVSFEPAFAARGSLAVNPKPI